MGYTPPVLTASGNTTNWLADMVDLLGEHHVVACGPQPRLVSRFGRALADGLRSLPETQVCVLEGSFITSLEHFCEQLGGALGLGHVARRLEGKRGVLSALRHRAGPDGRLSIKRRYYVWLDADVLLRSDHDLFSRLVDAIAGVAAESEYASEDLLLIQRCVFMGAQSLDAYAEDPNGQFCSWRSEGGELPLWRIVTGLERPSFLRYHVSSRLMEHA